MRRLYKRRDYLWERAEWPNLRFRADSLLPQISHLSERLGRLEGLIQTFPESVQRKLETEILTDELMASSAIEAVQLPRTDLHKAIADRLRVKVEGPPFPPRDIGFLADLAIDVKRSSTQPLSADRLYAWHNALFPSGVSGGYPILVGKWRDGRGGPMQVVSGSESDSRVHFVAPPAERVQQEMDQFLSWFNEAELDRVSRAAMAHLWFVTIHPFEDGNGRIGRAILNYALCGKTTDPKLYYSVSKELLEARDDYYTALERAQLGGVDVTEWIGWFIQVVGHALQTSESIVDPYRWANHIRFSSEVERLSVRQRELLHIVLENPSLKWTTSTWARRASCSQDSASRDLTALVEAGVLNRVGAGRSCSYIFTKRLQTR